MREFDIKKEALKENYNYYEEWEEKEKEDSERIVKELPVGSPRKGIKGKYLKKKNHVGRLQLKNSYGTYKKAAWNEFENM